MADGLTGVGQVHSCLRTGASPLYEQDRQTVRALFDEGLYIEVYVICPVHSTYRMNFVGKQGKIRKEELFSQFPDTRLLIHQEAEALLKRFYPES